MTAEKKHRNVAPEVARARGAKRWEGTTPAERSAAAAAMARSRWDAYDAESPDGPPVREPAAIILSCACGNETQYSRSFPRVMRCSACGNALARIVPPPRRKRDRKAEAAAKAARDILRP